MIGGAKVLVTLAVAAFLAYVMFGWWTEPGHKQPPPSPQPFSCSQLLQDVSTLDSGGSVAPVCGAAPYPVTPADSDSDGDAK